MSRFRPAGFRNGRTAWRRASRPDSGRPGTVRWHRATDLPLPPTVKRRSAGRPPPMARPRSEAQRGSVTPAALRSTHREMRCSASLRDSRRRSFILDELGYLPFAQTGSQLLFHLISRLYERTFRHQHHQSRLWRLAQRREPGSGRALHGGAHHRPG